jgi:RNA polymerase sigma factor (sigma-70 family)
LSSVHRLACAGPAIYLCAQAGCPACLERLLHHHCGLVHWVVRQTWRGELSYEELWQEGQIALWQAILHFDVERGNAFSSYAVAAMRHRLWRVVVAVQRPQGWALPTPSPDPAEAAAAAWQQQAVRAALRQLLGYLAEPRYQVIVAAYGLDGQPPRSLAAIGRAYGVSRERVRQWRNDALVRLRLPALCAGLRRLCDQNDKAAYQRAQALNHAWLRRRRGG